MKPTSYGVGTVFKFIGGIQRSSITVSWLMWTGASATEARIAGADIGLSKAFTIAERFRSPELHKTGRTNYWATQPKLGGEANRFIVYYHDLNRVLRELVIQVILYE